MFGFVRPAACRSSAPRSVTDGCPYPPLPCRAKNRNKIQLSSHRKQEINGNGGNSFHRLHELLPPLRRGTRSARPRGLGGDFEFLPLKSPRNPITPFETSRVATLHPGLYKNLREDARRVIGATAKPLYPIDVKAEGLDRRTPRPPSSREGDRPQAVEGVSRRWKSYRSHLTPSVTAAPCQLPQRGSSLVGLFPA